MLCAASAFGQNPQPMAVLIDTTSECATLRPWRGVSPQTEQDYAQQYDSLRKYIELCAIEQLSFHAFTSLISDCQYTNITDTTRFDRFREWCKSVLYLNTTESDYFCADLEAIATTYFYGKWKIPNAALAIFEYLANNHNCNSEGLQQEIKDNIRSRHDTWKTLHDGGDTTAEDTVLPSLEKLGLGFLLKQDVHGPVSPLPSQYLTSFTASQNPFKGETKLRFTLNRMAYITIDIFDELGRPYYGNGDGRTFEAGDQEVPIDGRSLPSGSLYARISTGFGEVKTVKLVHEK